MHMPHPKYRMGIALLFAGLLFSGVSFAGTISYDPFSFTFNDPVAFSNGTNDVLLSTTAPDQTEAGTYTLTAEFCQTGACTGDAFSNPSELRLTNMNITCSFAESGFCGAIDIPFQATGSTSDSFEMLNVMLDSVTLNGGFNSGFGRVCIASSSFLCSSDAQGSQSSTFVFNGSTDFTGSTSVSFDVNGSFTVVGDLHLDGLTQGNTFKLGNSFEITAAGSAASVPEPASLSLLPVGLAMLMLSRRRKKI